MNIETWTTPTTDREIVDYIVTTARGALEAALESDLRDDRFSQSWADALPGAPIRISVATDDDGSPIGYLGGIESDDGLQLDALVASEVDHPVAVLSALAAALEPSISAVEQFELWAKPAFDHHAELAEGLGLEPLRALHQMRCSLPVDATPVDSRPFIPGQDEEALLRVNNRAFASHPDQGNMTLDDLAAAAAEPWFDPEGIRLHEIDGELAGFCWTKIHEQPPLGEIYAIGIDPDHHGKGLGVPMTAAGLSWLTDQGLTTGMLYVEADNEPALRTYDRIGFTVLRTDRAWIRP